MIRKILFLILILLFVPASSHAFNIVMLGGSTALGGDEDVVAYWAFDDDALTVDSVGTNTLTNLNTTPDDTGDKKEGDASADLTPGDDNAFYMAEGDLDADFPANAITGAPDPAFTIVVWVKADALTTNHRVFEKGSAASTNDSNYGLLIDSSGYAKIYIGHSGGSLVDQHISAVGIITTGNWFLICAGFDDSDKSWRIRVYNAAGANIDSKSGTGANNMNVESSGFYIGRDGDGAGDEWDGHIDMMVILKRKLSTADMDKIAADTFNFGN